MGPGCTGPTRQQVAGTCATGRHGVLESVASLRKPLSWHLTVSRSGRAKDQLNNVHGRRSNPTPRLDSVPCQPPRPGVPSAAGGLSRLDRSLAISGRSRRPGRDAKGVPLSVGVVAEIKGRLPVADVVGETVQLKKAGTTLKGLCPFHGEKTPSFVVTPVRDTWHCFGCGKHGDIFTFVMERDGLAFPEALAQLAGRAGVELDERTKREDARNARLRDVMEAAVAFYHAVLTKSKPGEPALAYLRDRGFTDETIEKHQLGWAPGGWDTLVRQLASKRQVSAAELIEVGLASPRQRGGGAYDRFRERVIFPIRDQNGHAVGLGGRILGKEGTGEDGIDRGPEVPQLARDAAVRQEPDAVPHRPREVRGAQGRPGGDRRGLHGRADGAPGRLRQRRRQPRHRAHPAAGRAAHPVREADRARLRRRRGRAEGRHVRRHGARGAHPPAGPGRLRRGAGRRPRREPARGQGPGRGRAREPRRVARGRADRPAHRRPPDRRPCPRPRPAHAGRPGSLRRRGAADHPQPAQSRPSRRVPPARPPGERRGGADAARGDAPPPAAGRRPARRPGAVQRRGGRPCRGRIARQRHPARRLAHRAGAAAARAARPRDARRGPRRARAPTACRARSPASCTGRS